MSISEILSQATYRSWWKHIDPICATFSGFPYSSSFPLHWQSSTPFRPFHWPPCWPNQSRHIWSRSNHPVLWAFPSIDAIVCLYIGFIICLTVRFTVVWIVQVTIPVQLIFGVGNAFRCTILHTVGWMAAHWCELADVQHLSSYSREVICRQAGGKGDLSDNSNAATPSCWKLDQDALMISSVSEMYPMAVNCLFQARDTFCVARRFWLPDHISKKSWTLAILCNFLSFAAFFNSKSCSVSVLFNAVQSPATIGLSARANCRTMTFSRRPLPVV